MNESDFRIEAIARGYSEPRFKEFEPNLFSEMHGHDFAVFGLVTRGVLRLGYEDGSEAVFNVGEYCELPAGKIHSERTGSDGATFYLATM